MKKCMMCGGSTTTKRKMKAGGQAGMTKTIPIYNATTRPMQMKKGGAATKAAKFAALAPPYNKATAADRIAGAKKNARKRK